MSTIDFYFEFASPYSYLAAKGVAAIAAKHSRIVRWLPVDIRTIWQGRNLLEAYGEVRALKRDFIRKDSRMVAASRGISMAARGRPLANATLARLAVHHLNARSYAAGASFGMAVWDRFFGQGADISTEEDLLQAGHAQISPGELRTVLQNEAARKAFEQANETAQASGCFGVPWFVVEGETFFGQDRLELIDWWLQRRGRAQDPAFS